MLDHASLRSSFGIRFSLVARRWRQELEAFLAASGLTDATWIPLVHLQETGGGITQKDLAALVGIDGSSLVRLLDILNREGLIERRRDESDARARLIHLTPTGTQRVADIRRQLAGVEQHLLSDLPDTSIADMMQRFEQIEQRLIELKATRLGEQDR